jgi:hypothetical protein
MIPSVFIRVENQKGSEYMTDYGTNVLFPVSVHDQLIPEECF